jgi:signal transduction histidine kinase
MDLALEFMRFVEDQPDQSVDQLLDKILLKCRRLLGAEAGSIYLIEEQKDGALRVRPMCLQNDVIDVSNVELALSVDNQSIAGYVAATGKTVFVDDAYAPQEAAPYRFNLSVDRASGYRTVSVMAFPLRTFSEAVIGVVQLINRRIPGGDGPVPFEKAQRTLICPVNQLIGRAIQRTVLLDEVRARNAELSVTNRNLVAEVEIRRRTQDALEEALDAAQAASRAKGEFLANMSHELRTPLNSILGFAQVIATQHFGPAAAARYADYANDIVSSGNHLKAIIDDILDLAKIESGKATLKEEPLDVPAMLAEAIKLIGTQAESAGLALTVRLPDGPACLVGDERMVKQVLLNLLSNAVKFTPKGGRVEVSAGIDPGGGCYLTVSDTGIGMAEDNIPVAFEPFGQVANVYTRSNGGTGLGLPLVKSIVDLHGGRIDIDSALGRGTSVTIHFPPERTPKAA